MKATIAVLPGDGIGPEVVGQATELLAVIARKHGHAFEFVEGIIGGIAIDETGNPLPPKTVAICEAADAILLGAVGGPKWSDPTASVQPERGLLELRQRFGLFANLRPVKTYAALVEHAPLRAELLARRRHSICARAGQRHLFWRPARTGAAAKTLYDTMRYTPR